MTFHTPAPINYVYCTVVRSRLTDVATAASIEWETPDSSGVTCTVACSGATTDAIQKSSTSMLVYIRHG